MFVPDFSGSDGLDRVGHAGLEGMRRERQLDAPNPTTRVVLLDESDQLLSASDGQLLTRERGSTHLLEEVVDVDLLEQEPTWVQDILTFADHVILDRKELVGQDTAVRIPGRENLKLTLTVHGQELLKLGHQSSLLWRCLLGTTVAV